MSDQAHWRPPLAGRQAILGHGSPSELADSSGPLSGVAIRRLVRRGTAVVGKPSKPVHVLARRKWSEWSECTESCFRTRHRLNCDDLLLEATQKAGANSTNGNLQTSNGSNNDLSKIRSRRQIIDSWASRGGAQLVVRATRSTSGPAGASGGGGGGGGGSGGGQPLIVGPNIQDDDQDYADEGDEEDENDSCSKVEPSKTFVEEPCTGGLCKQVDAASLPQASFTINNPNRPSNPRAKGRCPLSLLR